MVGRFDDKVVMVKGLGSRQIILDKSHYVSSFMVKPNQRNVKG